MLEPAAGTFSFTETDLDFVVGEAAPGTVDRERLKRYVREDKRFRDSMVGDERVFQRVMNDEEAFVKISPALYFEVLLRQSLKELELATHTVERTGRTRIPVFDTRGVVELLSRPAVLEYLARMLASFTRIHSYVVPVRVRPGIRRRIRYNDMDIDSLLRFCARADERDRLRFYRRIADVCLFFSGVFSDHHRHPASGQLRPAAAGRARRSLEDYEREGRRFYGLAEQHPTAAMLELSNVFGLLRQHFASACKPLSFIASRYLHTHRHRLFGVQTGE